MIIAIIAGAVVVALKGFEYSIENIDHQRLEVILDVPYNEDEMDDLIDSVISDKYILRTSSLFKTIVAIDSKEFTDEEITNVLNKINEKYNTNYSLKNLKLSEIIDKYNLSDIENMEDKEVEDAISKTSCIVPRIYSSYNFVSSRAKTMFRLPNTSKQSCNMSSIRCGAS